MIELIAEKISIFIKDSNKEQTVSIPIMKFALIGILNTILIFLLCMTFGSLFGKFHETIISFFSFIFLRFFSGGYHFKSSTLCNIISTIIICSAPLLLMSHVTETVLLFTCIILIAIYAPSNIHKAARIPEKYFYILKVISLLIVMSNFLVNSPLLINIFFLQSLTLINKKEVTK